MSRFVLRRVVQALIVILGVTIISFFLRDLLPGSLARELDPRAGPLQIAQINRRLGLDRPLLEQYWIYLGQLARGDLGFSYHYNQPVSSLIRNEILRDVFLLGGATLVAVVIAVPIGVGQAIWRNRLPDYAGTTVAFFFYAMPDYVLGILLVAAFADHFHWFSATTANAPFGHWIRNWSGLTLPFVTEVVVGYAGYSRYMRASTIDTLTQDYIRTARAKGLSERDIMFHHVLRNSMVSMVTLIGLSVPAILTSGLIIEAVFNINGIGLQFYNSSVVGDYPTVLGLTVLIGALTVLGNLMADVSYALLDPRVRYG